MKFRLLGALAATLLLAGALTACQSESGQKAQKAFTAACVSISAAYAVFGTTIEQFNVPPSVVAKIDNIYADAQTVCALGATVATLSRLAALSAQLGATVAPYEQIKDIAIGHKLIAPR